jgi:hypothetical protein
VVRVAGCRSGARSRPSAGCPPSTASGSCPRTSFRPCHHLTEPDRPRLPGLRRGDRRCRRGGPVRDRAGGARPPASGLSTARVGAEGDAAACPAGRRRDAARVGCPAAAEGAECRALGPPETHHRPAVDPARGRGPSCACCPAPGGHPERTLMPMTGGALAFLRRDVTLSSHGVEVAAGSEAFGSPAGH